MINITEIIKNFEALDDVSEVIHFEEIGMLSIEFKRNLNTTDRDCLFFDLKKSMFGWTSNEFTKKNSKYVILLMCVAIYSNYLNSSLKYGRVLFTIRPNLNLQFVYETYGYDNMYGEKVREAKETEILINKFIKILLEKDELAALDLMNCGNEIFINPLFLKLLSTKNDFEALFGSFEENNTRDCNE